MVLAKQHSTDRDEYVDKFEEKKKKKIYIYILVDYTLYIVYTYLYIPGVSYHERLEERRLPVETLQANLQVSDQACVLISMFAYDCSPPQYIIRNVFRTRRPVTGQSLFFCAQSLLPPNSTAPNPYLQREVLPGSPEPHTYAYHSKCR